MHDYQLRLARSEGVRMGQHNMADVQSLVDSELGFPDKGAEPFLVTATRLN